jgi:Rrf2 family protein
MKVSKRTDYALRALFTLIDCQGGKPVSIRELAEQNQAPKRFLEHIMLDLKSQGWVDSVPGKDGGYVLARDPESITMGQVVRYFDGIIAPISCVSVNGYEPCSQEAVCHFRHVFLQIRNGTARFMDEMTLASVYAGSTAQQSEALERALIDGAGI